MPDKTWKAVERTFAKMFGVERFKKKGENYPDFETPLIRVEVKHRTKDPLNKFQREALEQSTQALGDISLCPVVFFHCKGEDFDESIAMMRVSDLVKLHELGMLWTNDDY